MSVTMTFVIVVLPVLTTCKLNVTGWPMPVCPPDGETSVLVMLTPGTPGAGKTVAVAELWSLASVGSV